MKAIKVLKNILNIADYGRYMEEQETIKEAIKELEELNNRSCDGCKYCFDNKENTGFCEYKDRSGNDGYEVNYIDNIKHFYCSRYEAKG